MTLNYSPSQFEQMKDKELDSFVQQKTKEKNIKKDQIERKMGWRKKLAELIVPSEYYHFVVELFMALTVVGCMIGLAIAFPFLVMNGGDDPSVFLAILSAVGGIIAGLFVSIIAAPIVGFVYGSICALILYPILILAYKPVEKKIVKNREALMRRFYKKEADELDEALKKIDGEIEKKKSEVKAEIDGYKREYDKKAKEESSKFEGSEDVKNIANKIAEDFFSDSVYGTIKNGKLEYKIKVYENKIRSQTLLIDLAKEGYSLLNGSLAQNAFSILLCDEVKRVILEKSAPKAPEIKSSKNATQGNHYTKDGILEQIIEITISYKEN